MVEVRPAQHMCQRTRTPREQWATPTTGSGRPDFFPCPSTDAAPLLRCTVHCTVLQHVWAPHPLHVWVPAQLVGSDGGVSRFRTESGEEIALPDEHAARLERVSDQSLVSHTHAAAHCGAITCRPVEQGGPAADSAVDEQS